MIVAKLKDGDTFRIGDAKYRAMVKLSDAWGCRVWDGEEWTHAPSGGYCWFGFDTEIEGYEKFAPSAMAAGEDVDPMKG
jgi:hypothetical protein